MMPAVVWADDGVATQQTYSKRYYTEAGSISSEKVECFRISANAPLTEEWYYVNTDMTVNADLTVDRDGTVNFIVASGKTLTINGTLTIKGNNTSSADLKIYGETEAGGYVVVNNSDSSKSNGSAIVSKDEQTAYIQLIGGEMTATGTGYNAEDGKGAALSNVRLLSEINETIRRTAKVKCIRTGSNPEESVTDTQKETSVTISRCECAEKDWKYEQGENNTHRGYCNLCGYISNWNGATGGYEECNFDDIIVSAGNSGHYGMCYCGNKTATVPHGDFYTLHTDDGKGHTSRCFDCRYTPETSLIEDHNYNTDGECEGCGFKPIAKDDNDNLYETVSDALKGVNNGGTVTLNPIVEPESKEINEEVEFNRAGVTVNLVMNGYTLKNERNSTLTVENGTLTIEDNATIIQTGSNEMVASAIRVTGGVLIFAGSLIATGGAYNSHIAPAIEVTGGKVTFAADLNAKGGLYNDNANNPEQKPAIYATGGELDFQGNHTLNFDGGLTLIQTAKLTNKLTHGTFWTEGKINSDSVDLWGTDTSTKNSIYNVCLDLLADGYAFAVYDRNDTEKVGDIYNANRTNMGKQDVTIVEHTHEYKPNGSSHSCICGKSELHSYINGKCSICEYGCSHPSGSVSNPVGEEDKWFCSDCSAQMSVKIENGDTTTYSTDFTAAMNAAENGTTITLLKDIERGSTPKDRATICGDGKIVTLDLNEHKITGGWIDVGDKDSNNTYTTCTLKIIGKGSYEPLTNIGSILVALKATLDLSKWKGGTISKISIQDDPNYDAAVREAAVIVGPEAGTIGCLGFESNRLPNITRTKLSGGRYAQIYVADFELVKLGELLAEGYAFQKEDESYVEYTTTLKNKSIYNVKVVKCPHSEIDVADDGEKTCKHCGLTGKFVATVDGNAYTSWDEAFKAWLGDGGTLKLYDDYTASDGTWHIVTGSHKIDLNGHKLSVSNDGAFKPSNNMGLIIQDTSEDQDGEISHILLSEKNPYWSLTLNSGNIGNLEVGGHISVGIHGGNVDNLKVLDWPDDAHFSIDGGSLGAYSLPSGIVLADVLEHQYYATGTSLEKTADTALIGEKFVIAKAPTDFGPAVRTGNVAYGGNIPFTVDAVDPDVVGAFSVEWYRRTASGVQLMETMTFNNNSAEGVRTQKNDAFNGVNAGDKLDVFCVIKVKKDDNSIWQMAIMNYKLTVTPADLSDATITIKSAGNALVYTGNPITANYEVKCGETVLNEGADFTVTGNSATNAGTHTMTITAKEDSNYTGSKDQTWTINPASLTVSASATDKIYDGNPDAKENVKLNFTGLVNNETLSADDYAITANYDNAMVGDNKTITGTVTLNNTATANNYVLADGNFNTTGKIVKADAPVANTANLDVVNNHAASYTVDLASLIPVLEGNKEYGGKKYDVTSVNLGDYYTSCASVDKDGMLTLPINKVDSNNTGSIGTVTVKVTTDNYEDITLTVNVSAVNKDVPKLDGTVTLTPAKLTYGDKLSKITASGTMKDSLNETVAGSFTWKLPEHIPGAGTYEAEWIFTPEAEDKYISVTGTVEITVDQADVTGSPKYTAISEDGKTLTNAGLTTEDATFSVEGTVKWIDKDGKDLDLGTAVKQGEKYKWIFTPADTANYNTLTGEITLWPYPAAGGGIAPADEDVITVEDKTSSETTTKTTVKDTKTETVKNEQGEEISKVTATVSEKVAEKLVDQAVSNKSDTVEITVKSNDGNKVDGEKQTEIEIPKKTVESIAKDTEADLVIKTDNGQVVLDNKTLETIAAAAEGDTVRIVVNENTQLKETQKPAEDVIGKNGKLFDIKAVIGGKYIHDFRGGKAHVTLPMPEKLKGKDIVIIYINDKGICEILNHTMETVGADEYIKFTTSHFSNFAVVEKADAEKIIEQQNTDKINSLIKEAKLKATTSKTSKKNVKIKVSIKNNSSLIKEAKAMGYTVKYKFYRSTKKASKYKAIKTRTSNSYINTKGKKGTRYYYKAKVMVYDGKKLVAQTALKQCSYGARRWSK